MLSRAAVVRLILLGATAVACESLTTAPVVPDDVFDTPLPGLTAAELAAFVRGDAEFSRRFAPSDGLGPIFNNASCISCHSGDGRGFLDNALQRVGNPENGMLREFGGPQIQDKAIVGAHPEVVPHGAAVSLRLPPPVFGVGLIEAIQDQLILGHADPDDRDHDGISGRPNFVSVPEFAGGGTHAVGRFGRKAQVSNVLQQVTEAYLQDMGITTDFLPEENVNPLSREASRAADRVADPELPASTVHAVATYVRLLAPSAAGEMTTERKAGEALFSAIKCATCHVPEMRTGPNHIAALSNQSVKLFSDLLLHDMGEALSDGRPDGEATAREWRTAPLWGLRIASRFLNGSLFLLHDGRARTVEEAILLHGGEAQRARDAFAALTPAEKRALLEYVASR